MDFYKTTLKKPLEYEVESHNFNIHPISYALTKVPMQAYVAELERENLVEIRVTAGINRAHAIDKSSTHPIHHNAAVIM